MGGIEGRGAQEPPVINCTFPANLKLTYKENWRRQASPKGIQIQFLKNVKKGFFFLINKVFFKYILVKCER